MSNEEIVGQIKDTSEAPRGKDIFYKCLKCGESVSSQPRESVECKCGNVVIDVGYHRLHIDDLSKMQVVRRG
jgi:hypothetical protein